MSGTADLPDPFPIDPLPGPFDVTLTPPGSKSITCRAYVLAALAEGPSRIVAPLHSEDTDGLLGALATLGAESRTLGDEVEINGVGGRFPGGGTIHLGDGGAPSRFMVAAACLAEHPVTIDGSERLRERPIDQLVQFLHELGAHVKYLDRPRRLPIRVSPSSGFRGGTLKIPATLSSQFISALLLVGSCLPKGLRLRYTEPVTSASYVALTHWMMLSWGIDVRHTDDDTGAIREHAVLPAITHGRRFEVEPDASSAAYWWAAALLTPGAAVATPGLVHDSRQPDTRFLDLFYPVEHDDAGSCWTHSGTVVRHDTARPIPETIDAAGFPDAAMTLAVIAARAETPVRIDGLATLRVKESDRIEALATELRRIGCAVETADDAITIDPAAAHDEPVEIQTYRDHRMAMAFAVLGLVRGGISIVDPGCVEKSYPGFWADMESLRPVR